jgi:hypothetical protein
MFTKLLLIYYEKQAEIYLGILPCSNVTLFLFIFFQLLLPIVHIFKIRFVLGIKISFRLLIRCFQGNLMANTFYRSHYTKTLILV